MGWMTSHDSNTRFLASFEGVILNRRALLVLGIWSLDARYRLAKTRYVKDSTIILSDGLLYICANKSRIKIGRSRG